VFSFRSPSTFQVRRVIEYRGATDTGSLSLDEARPEIQVVWKADVDAQGATGPRPLANTPAALDPALWFWGKWGVYAMRVGTAQSARRQRSRALPLCRSGG